MTTNTKREGKTPILFDQLDVVILKFIFEKMSDKTKVTITDVKNYTGLTHANLITHLNRLEKLIQRERDKQTIYLTLTEIGIKAKNIFEEVWKIGETVATKYSQGQKISDETERIRELESEATKLFKQPSSTDER